MEIKQFVKIVIAAMEDLKALDIDVFDVSEKTSFTDRMIVASGTSNRHVKSIAENIVVEVKKHAIKPLGVEGDDVGEWVLVDLGDVIIHVMLPQTREFYSLEKVWEDDE